MDVICAFCMTTYAPDTYVCPRCDEYKGLMPLNQETANYLDIDLDDYL